ncbi:MAG TPA: 1-deoxy-D-xylulose-5-phosphate synthase [Dehalococcoidia bacterium]|nr:1-deoxy-D-xylulose-5-phosphate synthase [Dehalococcoidia bacterium]
MTLLDRIDDPAALKGLTQPELEQLAAEVRDVLLTTISENGGHLASNLGVVELTIALHRVFDSPRDKLIWDVSHQSYVHKLLTGRRDRFSTLRQYGGLSGFVSRSESPHDAFDTGHASTSISVALGMALARDLAHERHHVLAVIGDGALTGGMALEAMNHASHLNTKIIVVLNDNGMAISPNIGAVAKLLTLLTRSPRYEHVKADTKRTLTHLPLGDRLLRLVSWAKTRIKGALIPGAFWEKLGFAYVGPVDGHNLRDLEVALLKARDAKTKTTIVHVITEKGKGYPPAEKDSARFHGLAPNGHARDNTPASYSEVFGSTVLRLMKQDERLVAITAAMCEATGLDPAARAFPDRVFDVGICEEHAVTLAAGMSARGLVPIVAIYSTFLQRAFDQIIHDVCIQNLPVVFAIDRAGIVGEDGRTHQGAFDLSYLRCLPNLTVAAPKDEDELRHLLFTATKLGGPMAIRYPRGRGVGAPLSDGLELLPVGVSELLRSGDEVTIAAAGPAAWAALAAAQELAASGVECNVVNARFVKPLDSEMLLGLASRTGRLVTVEENVLAGGFGSAVLEAIESAGMEGVRVERIGLPDRFIEHGPQEIFRSMFDLDSEGIVRRVRAAFPELGAGIPASLTETVGGSS